MITDVKKAAELLKSNDDFLILSHANPDGDTLGCAYGLCGMLQKMGKRAKVMCADEIAPRMEFLRDTVIQQSFEEKTIVSVDVADRKLLGDLDAVYGGRIFLAIDHHESRQEFAKYTLVDPEAAEIVKLIYDLCLQGMARRSIVYHLNDHGIPSPATYRKEKGLPVSSPSDTPLWGDKAVTLILTNPIYTGDLVQGRRRVKSYKVHQIEEVPEEEWVRVPDTHKAIIDRETFEKVQSLLKRDTRRAPRTKELHLFSGFLRCADCGKSVTRSSSGQSTRYLCSTYKNRPAPCTLSSMSGWRPLSCSLYGNRYIWRFPTPRLSPGSIRLLSKKASLSDWTI